MLIIYNANIHTLDPAQSSVSAIAIDHGIVQAVGKDDDILAISGVGQIINGGGRTIIPGLIDAHIHLQDFAFSQLKINCETTTRIECLRRVAERVKRIQPGEWVLGHGWNQNNWPEGYGSILELDVICPDNPVYLTHKSLHSAWVNTMALHLAGIDRNTSDPPGGLIGHFANGEPSGILYESAVDLIESILPEPSLAQVLDSFRSYLPMLSRFGLTGVHDFDRTSCFSALQLLHQSGELNLRVVKGIPVEDLPSAISMGLRTGFGDDALRIGPVKLFADGALGPHSAAMLQSYEDDPKNFGISMLTSEELFEYGQKATSHGISLAVHAIGDHANREMLDGFAQLRKFEHKSKFQPGTEMRHRIEHAQLLHPDDIPRFTEMDIIASMQPIHATSDMQMADRYWGKRSSYAYAWRSLLAQGARLIFGSDAPVESPNPFWGIHAAITRCRADGTPSTEGWYPEQRLHVNEAVEAYTTGPAYAANLENRLGKLCVGYLADLVILDCDPYICTPGELLNLRPVATMAGGQWVYSELE